MTQGSSRPSLMTRVAALMRGEVRDETIEAFRQAGQRVYGDLLAADAVRERLAVDGTDLWHASAGTRSQLLCTWNAYALQTLGEAFLVADEQADPMTVGYLPPVTAEQVARFLGQVEHWSSAARRGAADPGFDVLAGEALPAPLPPWVEVEPCPAAHLAAMRAAAQTLADSAEHALADFLRAGVPKERTAAADRLAGFAADARSAAEYGASLAGPGPAGARVHEAAEASLHRAIEGFYRLGQLLAAPMLLDRPQPAPTPVGGGGRLPLPGEPGFDPWVLTSPPSRARWRRDPSAVRAVQNLWRYDPDPAATLAVQGEIDAAVRSGALQPWEVRRGAEPAHFYCCPWGAIYLVRRPVVLAGRALRVGEQVTFDVSAEDMARGGRFRRELVTGPFGETDDIDYCDPAAGGHDD